MDQITSAAALKDELICFGELKVWSVLVTLFGDMAPSKNDSIPGPLLTAITGQMGIKPAALRVALHRLRKDGWLEATKSGRISHNTLSEYGRSETEGAMATIYDANIDTVEHWHLVLLGKTGTDRQVPVDWVAISDNAFITRNRPAPQHQAIVTDLNRKDIPEWVFDTVIAPEINDAYRALFDLLSAQQLPGPELCPLQRLTLRILVLHNWRRTVLRHSASAALLMDKNWIGAKCRCLIHSWLSALPRPDLHDTTLIR